MANYNTYVGRDGNIIVAALINQEPDGFYQHIDCFAFHADSPELPVKLDLCVRYEFDMKSEKKTLAKVELVDLVGNGEGTNNTNKGIGTVLVTSALGLVRHVYSQARESKVTLSGSLSDSGDSKPESHERRVHFWQKVGMIVADSSHRFSRIDGDLDTISPVIPPESFTQVEFDKYDIKWQDCISHLEWSANDEAALSQMIELAHLKQSYDHVDAIEVQISNRDKALAARPAVFNMAQLIYESVVPPKADKLAEDRYRAYRELNEQKTDVGKQILDIDKNHFGLLNRAASAGIIHPHDSFNDLLNGGRLSIGWANSHNSFRQVIDMLNNQKDSN